MTALRALGARGLLDWMDTPDEERGLSFFKRDWVFHSYAELAGDVGQAAGHMAGAGVQPGHRVAISARTGPGLVASIFGSWYLGATPCVLPHPFAFGRPDEYLRHVGQMLGVAQPAYVVSDEQAFPMVTELCARLGGPQPLAAWVPGCGADAARGDVPELALVQFTSGSSGSCRAVGISRDNLRANLGAMRTWLHWLAGTRSISWLPPYHDMGLVGAVLNNVVTGSSCWLMGTDDFLRRPRNYLQAISENHIELTAMPNFGLDYILRRVPVADVEGLDLSFLRSIVLGAERIDPAVVGRFISRFGPVGLRGDAIRPAYGCAEATLAITGLAEDSSWAVAAPDGGADSSALVGCGQPLDGVTVDVMTEDGRPAAEGEVGEIVVGGPSVAPGYLPGSSTSLSRARLEGGKLFSGDAGFMRKGQLFVIGRLGDGLKVNGKMVFAETVESALLAAGIPARRAIVLLGHAAAQPRAVVLLLRPEEDWPDRAERALGRYLPPTVPREVRRVERDQMLFTSSGKPRRRDMWRALMEGDAVAVG